MGNTRNTGYLQNIVLYDENDNITLPARLAVTGTVSVNNTTPYDTTQFSLDVNGGLIVKNINKTAQFVLINSNPASGGNNAFVVHTVGGTSASSYADIQGYYGTSIAGSTVLRLNPQGGNVLVGSLAGTGNRMVVASATGVLSTQAIVTLGDLSGVSTARALTINGTTYDLSADRTWTLYTDNISEDASPVNLWFTNARARAAISVTGSGSYDSETGVITVTGGVTSVNTLTGAVTLTTSNISEGTNLYYTDARVSSYLTANNYATQSYVGTQIANLVDAAPGTLDTLNELAAALGDDPNFATSVATSIGTKQAQLNGTGFVKVTGTTVSYDNSTYLTTSNAASTYVSLSGSYANPAWITSLAWSKITGAPAFITSYTEVDTLSSVTGRGASTSTQVTFSGAGDNTITYSSVRFAGYNQGGGVGYHGFFEIQNTYGSVTNGKKFFRIDGTGSIQIINSAYTANIFNLTDTGVLTVGSIIKSGGTSSQFLKADGSVDSSTYLTGITSSQVTTALGYTPYNATNPSGYISSYTETDTLSSVTGRGATTSSAITINRNTGGLTLNRDATSNYTGIYYSTAGATRWFIGMRENLTSNNHIHYSEQIGVDVLTLNIANGNAVVYGNISAANLSGTNTGDQTNISGNAATATNVAWTGVTGRPTALSSFTNDLGNYGSWITASSLNSYLPLSGGSLTGDLVNAKGDQTDWYIKPSGNGPTIRMRYSGGTTNRNAALGWMSNTPTYSDVLYWTDSVVNSLVALQQGGNQVLHAGNYTSYSPSLTGANASGTWGITITGSAGSAGYADRIQTGNNQWTWTTGAHTATNPNTITLWDQYSSNGGAGYLTAYATIVDIYGRSGHEHDQLYFDSSGTIYHRNCFYGTNSWNGWRTMLDSSNYNSYSPTLTGGGASGTWGINITGSAGSAGTATSAVQVVTIQDSAPSGSAGKLWWESDTGKLKVYYGSAWVDASPIPDSSLFFAKAGGSITGDVTVGQTLNVVGNTLVQGNINAFGDITAYSSSDARLKDNITVIESPLEKLSKINGVSFNWNDKQTAYEVGKKDIGVIAQEIEEVLPELVTTRDNGYKAVRYEKIVALLIEAVKEQQTQINNLTDKLNNL